MSDPGNLPPAPKRRDYWLWMKFLEHFWGSFVCLAGFVISVALGAVMKLAPLPWLCLYAACLALAAWGGVLVVRAKLPTYRAGRFFSWGVEPVPVALAPTYRLGWRLFRWGVGLALFAVVPRLLLTGLPGSRF